MNAVKILGATTLVGLATLSHADDKTTDPMGYLSWGTSVITTATSMLCAPANEKLQYAKDDAITFIGSDGTIRGALLEQAVHEYHASYPAPHMNDRALALAIVTAY